MLLPLLAIGFIAYRYYYQAIWESTRVIAGHAITNLAVELEQIMSAAGQFLEVGTYMAAERYLTERGDTYSSAKEILSLMNLYRGKGRSTPDIKDIYLVGINGRGISEREGVFCIRRQFMEIPALNRLYNAEGEAILLNFYRSDLSGYWNKPSWQSTTLTETSPSLGLGKVIFYSIRHEVIGAAVVEINPGRLGKICREQSASSGIDFSVYDSYGGFVLGNEEYNASFDWQDIWRLTGEASRGQFIHALSGRKVFFVYYTSPETGLRIIGQAALDTMMNKAYRIKNMTIISVAGVFFFTMLLYAFISDRITKPIKDLQDKMRIAASGKMDVRFKSSRKDEIADLGNSFNTMIEHIKKLMIQAAEEQENSRKAEFRALQSQINPHFLYNTLDSIVWMSQASRHEEVMTMAVALSNFFRLTLNSGREIVTVGEEVEHARNYLVIQRMRYGDILDFEISVNPEITGFRMIRLTLQPLIENAIYHGLKTKRGGGKIRIEGARGEGAVMAFTIRDNGAGMSRARLREVVDEMRRGTKSEFETEKGYALRNFHERLRLVYGSRFDLSIWSEEGAGTVVKMILPLMEADDV
jgi:two-component system sensor histidine kinase YesM